MKRILAPVVALIAFAASIFADSLLTEKPTAPARAAKDLVAGIQSSKRAMLGELRHNIALVWGAPNPQAVIDQLGTRAAEAFWLSNEFATFLQSIMTAGNDAAGLAELASILSAVKPVTVNQDGTVTVNVEPEE